MLTNEEILEISEQMGEAAHIAWMEKRKKEKGWHAPEECPGPPICPACNGAGKVTTGLTTGGSETHNCVRCSGKGRVQCIACHPCMRPYKDLPDSEKELDRAYPALFFKILAEMGYGMVSEKDLETEEKTYELDRKTIKELLTQRDELANDIVRAAQRIGDMEVDAFKPPCERQNCCCYLNPAYECPKIPSGDGIGGPRKPGSPVVEAERVISIADSLKPPTSPEGLTTPKNCGKYWVMKGRRPMVAEYVEGKWYVFRNGYWEVAIVTPILPLITLEDIHCPCNGQCHTEKSPCSFSCAQHHELLTRKHHYCPECRWEVSAVGHKEGCKFGSDIISKMPEGKQCSTCRWEQECENCPSEEPRASCGKDHKNWTEKR